MTAISIDETSPLAPFEQIRSAIEAHIRSGHLPPSTRLPSVRQLAADLGVAPNTAARAYRELERAGLVVTQRGGGTVVADLGAANQTARHELMRQAASRFMSDIQQLGGDLHEAHSVLDEVG